MSGHKETSHAGEGLVRIHLAAGDFITRFPSGGPYRLRLETPVERPWRARSEGDQIRPTHPGTALLFQDRYYEVVLSESGEDGLIHYYLAPWQDEFVFRQVAELSAQSSEAAAVGRRAARSHRKRQFVLLLASPFLGLLPARDQRSVEKRYGINPRLGTTVSAALIGVPATFFTILGTASSFAVGFGAGGDFDAQRYLLPASYFMAESWFRIWASVSAGEPAGSLPVVIVTEAVRAIRRRFHRT